MSEYNASRTPSDECPTNDVDDVSGSLNDVDDVLGSDECSNE